MNTPESFKNPEQKYENPSKDLQELQNTVEFNKGAIVRTAEKTREKKIGGNILGLDRSTIKVDETPLEEAKAYRELAEQQAEIQRQADLMNQETDSMYANTMENLDREDMQNQMETTAALNQLQPFDQA